MKHIVPIVIVLLCLARLAVGQPDAEAPLVSPFEAPRDTIAATKIDELVVASLQAKDITPANLCSDAVFVRRVYLDVTGLLPEWWQARAFINDKRPNKRSRLIDDLLDRQTFADCASLKWCDLLRVKAEFPINLWPNGVQAYHRWIRDAMVENKPYDQFVRELLTSSGSNFRVPPVNFYRAVQGKEPASLAAAASLTFMGTRFDSWSPEQRQGLEAMFSRVAFKPTAEWKEEIVYLDPTPTTPLTATMPDGTKLTVKPGDDPRKVFADWLIDRKNPWFTRNISNRVWYWLMGRGIIHEPDDLRPNDADNPPANPELLVYLQQELINSSYDLKHLYRIILNSRTYQQSPIARSDHPDAARLFACYPARRLDAEVLADVIAQVFGPRDSYESPIPEPFTYIPPEHRTVALADGSTTSQFLEMFGRPSRDTGLESERDNRPTDAQRLHMLNSSHIQQKIERSWRLRSMINQNRGDRRKMVDMIYLALLSRQPSDAEFEAVRQHFADSKTTFQNAVVDLAWALINSKEFLYRH